MHFISYNSSRFSSEDRTEALQGFPDDGLDHLVQSFIKKGLSPEVVSRLIDIAGKRTIKQYNSYWIKFKNWCLRREIGPGDLSVNNFCLFMISLSVFHHMLLLSSDDLIGIPIVVDRIKVASNLFSLNLAEFRQYLIASLQK